MGTCCATHLASKVREYAPNAENGAVTVQLWQGDVNPSGGISRPKCDYCEALPEFTVTYYPKKQI